MNHLRELKKYFKGILLVKKNKTQELSPLAGIMIREIPQEFRDKAIEHYKASFLTLDGKELNGFKSILKKLRKDIATEYLKDKELEKKVWFLFCDIFINKDKYDCKEVFEKRLKDFLTEICKPLKSYEISFCIIHLQLNSPISIWGTEIKKLLEDDFKNIKINPKDLMGAKVVSEFKGKAVIQIPMSGNNENLAIERARERAELVLKAVQTYLSDHMSIRDENLLFKISEFALIRDIQTQKWSWNWKAKRKPYGLKIGGTDRDFIDKAESHYKIAKQCDKKLLSIYERAVYWTARSIEEEDLDTKIIYLCIALEALLASKDDKRKGEVIAYRMVLINHLIDGNFPDPFKIMWFYEIRSKVVHGATLFGATNSDCLTLQYMVRKTLFNFVALTEKYKVKMYKKFIKAVETPENLNLICNHFKLFKGKWPDSIIEILEEKLKK